MHDSAKKALEPARTPLGTDLQIVRQAMPVALLHLFGEIEDAAGIVRKFCAVVVAYTRGEIEILDGVDESIAAKRAFEIRGQDGGDVKKILPGKWDGSWHLARTHMRAIELEPAANRDAVVLKKGMSAELSLQRRGAQQSICMILPGLGRGSLCLSGRTIVIAVASHMTAKGRQ